MSKALKKPAEERKHSKSLLIRIQPDHDAMIREAAEKSGLSLSSWIRERLLKAARAELKKD